MSPAWYPQVVLVNASGLNEISAVILRVEPDGSSTLTQTINAIAKAQLNLRRTPFDSQRLEAVFEVLGFDTGDVTMVVEPSFVGILTAVTYQIVLGTMMPQISYLTLMNGFVNIRFVIMCATVVINLIVGAADHNGYSQLGDRIDRRSRIAFPLVYFGLLLGAAAIAFL